MQQNQYVNELNSISNFFTTIDTNKDYNKLNIDEIIEKLKDKDNYKNIYGLENTTPQHFMLMMSEIKRYSGLKSNTKIKKIKEKFDLFKDLKTDYQFQNEFDENFQYDLNREDFEELQENLPSINVIGINNSELKKLNKIFLNENIKINPYQFYLMFTNDDLYQKIYKSVLKSIDYNKKDIKELLAGFQMDLNSDSDLANLIESNLNNQNAEMKSWIILFKEEYDTMTDEEKKKFTSVKDILNHINNASLNEKKPFVFDENGKLIKFRTAEKGEIDNLYYINQTGTSKTKIKAVEITVDRTGTIDRKRGKDIYKQSIPLHFLQYLMILDKQNELDKQNQIISQKDISLIKEKIRKMKKEEIEQTTIELGKLHKEAIDFKFFNDHNETMVNKFHRTVDYVVYSFIHNQSGDYRNLDNFTEQEKEYSQILFKNIKPLSLNDVYFLDNLKNLKRNKNKTKNEITIDNEDEKSFIDDKQQEFTKEVYKEFLKYFKEIKIKKEEVNLNNSDEIESIYKIKHEKYMKDIKSETKNGSEKLPFYSYISNADRNTTIKNIDKIEKILNSMFFTEENKGIYGDFIYFNLLQDEENVNNVELLETFSIIFNNTFSSQNRFQNLFDNKKAEQREEELKNQTEQEKQKVEQDKLETYKKIKNTGMFKDKEIINMVSGITDNNIIDFIKEGIITDNEIIQQYQEKLNTEKLKRKK